MRLKTFSIALTRVYHAVAWPTSGVAEPWASLPFADRYTLEQSNTLLKQSACTMYNLCPTNLLSLAMTLYTIKSKQTRITKTCEFKKGVGIDYYYKSTETKIPLAQFSLQKFNPYFWLIIKLLTLTFSLCQK